MQEEKQILAEHRKAADGNFSLYTYHDHPEVLSEDSQGKLFVNLFQILAHLDSLAAENEDVETEVILLA